MSVMRSGYLLMSPATLGENKVGDVNGTKRGLHPCQEGMNIPTSRRNIGQSILGILILRTIRLRFMDSRLPGQCCPLALATPGDPNMLNEQPSLRRSLVQGQSSIDCLTLSSHLLFNAIWYSGSHFHWSPTSQDCGSVSGSS